MQDGILKGVNKIIDEILEVKPIGKEPYYHHKTACDQLHQAPLQNFAAADLLEQVYVQIENNWKEERPYKEHPSRENWRFEPKRNMAMKNPSLEIQLERAIVNINPHMWPEAKSWTNQVPTASGLCDHKYDKRRAIDLVHLHSGQNRYDAVEFIELKVDRKSGHPVYAAMEVLLYGLLYVFSRRHLEELEYDVTEQPLLQAKTINLVVLAPFRYFDGYQFKWLEKAITDGLRRFLKPDSYTMDFQFQSFPWDCSFEKSIPDEPLIIIKALNDRKGLEDIRRQYWNEAKRLGYEADRPKQSWTL